jgi:quinolinate synthase
MKLITMEKIYNCLKRGKPEIKLNEKIILAAQKPIRRMLDISGKMVAEK